MGRFCELPLLDAFRTVNWKRIREELKELKLILGLNLAPSGLEACKKLFGERLKI